MAQLPMYAAMVNSPGTELAADINATATSIDVLDASKLPAAPNLVTVGGDETAETIRYTGKTGNTLTGCTRGFEGTAKGWAAGSPAARNHTAYDYEAGRVNIADVLVSAQGYAAVALDGANTYTDEKFSVLTANYIRQPGYAITAGNATSYAVTLDPVPTSLPEGFGITIVPHVASGAAPTLNVNGLGAVALKKQDGSAFAAGDLKVNTPYTFRKVGSNFLADSGGGEVKINGQTISPVTYSETITALDPIYTLNSLVNDTTIGTYPAGNTRGVTWSPGATHLACALNVAPYLTIYKRSDKAFTKLPDPSTLPTGGALGAEFSPDGTYLAITTSTSPYITIYKRSGDTFTKLSNPAVLPTDPANGVGWSPDGTYLIVGQTATPFMNIYKRSGDTFTRLSNPATLPTGQVYDAAFTPDGIYMAVAHLVSPFVTIYKRTGDTFAKLADPAVLPTGSGISAAFSPDNNYLVVTHSTSPFITIYKRTGDSFAKLPDPASLPGGNSYGASFSSVTGDLTVGHTNSPFISTYERSGDIFTKKAAPNVTPTGLISATEYSPDGSFLAAGSNTANYLIIYSAIRGTYRSDNLMSNLQNAVSAGYALESGSAGDTKNAVLIWRS